MHPGISAGIVPVVVAIAIGGTTLFACPFCGVVGRSLAERRDAAAAVAVGEADGPAQADRDGAMTQPFQIRGMIRGDRQRSGQPVSARVAASVAGTTILFGDPGDGPEEMRWSAVAADEPLLGHVATAPASNAPAASRLRWFAARLEHPEPGIAADAFTEFGLAPLAAVREAADAFDREALRRWVTEPGIDPRRRGFYGLALGIVAAAAGDGEDRRRSIEALRSAIAAPSSDFRAGFDGLLGGLLVAEGPRALEWFDRIGLFGPAARPADQKHLLSALRFAWEELDDEIPRDQITAAMARLLTSPVVAADVVVDLTRQQAWDHAEAVAALWE
ncbi:MAG: hypothetical protein ACKOEX_11725, partial [Planctomycetia bacterium]